MFPAAIPETLYRLGFKQLACFTGRLAKGFDIDARKIIGIGVPYLVSDIGDAEGILPDQLARIGEPYAVDKLRSRHAGQRF